MKLPQGPVPLAQLRCRVLHVTFKNTAVRITYEGKEEWLPKAQIQADRPLSRGKPYDAIITMPEWLAVKKGFIERKVYVGR